MSEETLRASLMSTGPLIAWPALWRTWLASIRSEPVSLKIVFGAIRWFCSAAVAVVGLEGAPLGYRPRVARVSGGAARCSGGRGGGLVLGVGVGEVEWGW